MQTVYIETTIPSYLAAHTGKREPVASHQKMTRDWWSKDRHKFLVYSSLLTKQELSRGDPLAAKRRLEFIQDIPQLGSLPGIENLETDLARLFQLPLKARPDAGHLAMAILHRMDYLLTWNCTHLANATLQRDLVEYCHYHRLHVPIVCTPENLH